MGGRQRRSPSVGVRTALAAVTGVATAGAYVFGPLPDAALGWLAAVVLALGVFHVAPTGPFSRRAGRALLVLSALLLSATLLDLLLRPLVNLEGPRNPTNHGEPVVDQRELVGDLARLAERPDLGVPRTVAIHLDADGFRNTAEATAQGPPYDVLVLGDSFGFGDGTTQEATWPERLRREYGLHVYNLSRSGGDPWDEFLTLEAEGARLGATGRTRVLWALFLGNDLDELHRYEFIAPDEDERWAGLGLAIRRLRDRSPLQRMLRQLSRRGTPSTRAPADSPPALPLGPRVGEPRPEHRGVQQARLPDGRPLLFHAGLVSAARRHATEIDAASLRQLASVFELMRKLAERRGLRVSVLLLPSKFEVYGWALEGTEPWPDALRGAAAAERVTALAESNGMPVLDLRPALVAAARARWERTGELLWWPDDPHVDPHGHAVIAEQVHDALFGDGVPPAPSPAP